MERRTFIQGVSSLIGAAALPGASMQSLASSGNFNLQKKTQYTHNYSPRDHEILEYSFHEHRALPGMVLRGPAVDIENRNDYFTCIGAAQTLGVYTPTPFPELLTQQLGLTAWNLGIGGANPYFFLQHPKLIDYINKGKFAILQVMTARDEMNDRIQPTPIASLVKDMKHNDLVLAQVAWQRILKEEPENLEKYLAQSRSSWERHMEELISKIKVPLIHFWFAPKKLDADINLDASRIVGIIDEYPQFINGDNLHYIKSAGEPLITCHSDRDQFFSLRSRYTGEVTEVDYASMDITGKQPSFKESKNVYYPSPQMHWDAAIILGDVIRARQLA